MSESPESGPGAGPLPPPPPYAGYPPPPPGYGPPTPYAAPPAKDGSLRIALIVVAVVVLACGGLFSWLVVSINHGAEQVGQAFHDTFDTDYPGSSTRPVTVEEGQAFSIRGFDYAAGWTIDGGGAVDLTATNHRPDRSVDTADLTVTLLQGSQIVAQFDCSTDVRIAYETSATLECDLNQTPAPTFDTVQFYSDELFG